MKRGIKWARMAALMLGCMLFFGMRVDAQGAETIKNGIFAGDIDLSGMSTEDSRFCNINCVKIVLFEP